MDIEGLKKELIHLIQNTGDRWLLEQLHRVTVIFAEPDKAK